MANQPHWLSSGGGIPVDQLQVLVIDEGELSRSVLGRLLRELGVRHQHLQMARRPEEARRLIKSAPQPYDLIISDMTFRQQGPHDMTGQDLLDELRQAKGLPMQTAFIMVTSEARYQHVAEALEGALDDYLLKPFTARQFEERLQVVLERKQAFKPVFQAIEAGDYAKAAQLCEAMFRDSATYKVYAARIGSELYLRLGQLDAARRMLEAVLAYKAVPWARLGLAKIDLGDADTDKACRALETLLAENPAYADAYDVYGRALLEEMKVEAAVEVLAKAVQITPGNVSRLQKLGSLQLYLGYSGEAAKHLGAALTIGANSRTLDYQGVVALAIASLDVANVDGCERAHKCLQGALGRHPDSYRVRTLMLTCEVALQLALRRAAPAQAGLRELASQIDRPEFTYEMAGNLLLLLVRCAGQQPIPEAMTWATRLARRFCVSRPRTRLLELAASAMPAIEILVRDTAQDINAQANEAMSHLVGKQHQRTLEALAELARSSLNARIINLAFATLNHHGQHLGADALLRLRQTIEPLHTGYTDAGRRLVERKD
ncbi:CheY-like chemotaxis protein/Tfp pilus assembly protein PilF [Pelomonas saccharophila]|uniref:CheY-like chemotaxis protein/Tfp pilus assembly protein PilF n=1 Tax=Roseateles saccharophilus TaxID=304 RepID=A0ABU1YXL8_ROSSA|nr:response regulator [Roseateles saccharophilus]MDR7272786.1 CheY-like chemotaxis protein/Tfp pilus assembly protein PilF [Roseateles saccharophilus]